MAKVILLTIFGGIVVFCIAPGLVGGIFGGIFGLAGGLIGLAVGVLGAVVGIVVTLAVLGSGLALLTHRLASHYQDERIRAQFGEYLTVRAMTIEGEVQSLSEVLYSVQGLFDHRLIDAGCMASDLPEGGTRQPLQAGIITIELPRDRFDIGFFESRHGAWPDPSSGYSSL